MKFETELRRRKRKAMHQGKTTFTDRVYEAIRTSQPVKDISFRLEKPPVAIRPRIV